MRFIADLHIHSHYSIATSKDLTPAKLDYWARMKGITVVGTGDFTHPGWIKELKEHLQPAEPGLFKLKDEFRIEGAPERAVRFVLTSEISNIYKKNGKVRKNHNVILAPDFETVERIQARLSKIGNITSDGRPILGLDAHDLLELVLEVNDRAVFIPAHIWTPWFSVLGSKSGFDSIEECFEDLTPHIFAVETGLSSDPPMNWMCSFLDRYTLVSNSDAHSPEKLGREANLFDTELSYAAMVQALRHPEDGGFLGTVEFYPQEGKYHFDGHRKCGIVWDPLETVRHNGLCPVCGKPLTVGVLSRVAQLSDRDSIEARPNRLPYHSLIPLKEALAEILNTGAHSKKVDTAYRNLIQKAGSEFDVLLNLPLEDLARLTNEVLVEAVRRMRQRQVIVKEGFDGQFGEIHVFDDRERQSLTTQKSLFNALVNEPNTHYHVVNPIPFDLKTFRELKRQAAEKAPQQTNLFENQGSNFLLKDLNPEQQQAVRHFRGPALVLAGPGSGKTKVLTHRMAYLIRERHVNPEEILAITFTNKAADEIRKRVRNLLGKTKNASEVTVTTFHALGYAILNEQAEHIERQAPIAIFDRQDRLRILRENFGAEKAEVGKWDEQIREFKLFGKLPRNEDEFQERFNRYEHFLQAQNAVDLEDLIAKPVALLEINNELAAAYRRRFQWLLVDEYQDINLGQYRLLKILTDTSQPNLFVIGDPNQAIYGFRGADVSFIHRFEHDFPQAAKYHLKISYRCTNQILQASSRVLNQGESGGFLTGLQDGVKIKIVSEATEKSEAEFVARTIEDMMGGVRFFSMDSAVSEGSQAERISSFSDFAILVRIGRLIPPIEKALNDHSIPYQVVGHDSWLRDEPVRPVIDVLRCALKPERCYLKEAFHRQGINGQDWILVQNYLQEKTTVAEVLEVIITHLLPPQSAKEKRLFKKLLDLSEPFGKDVQAFLQWTFLGDGQDLYQPSVERVTLMTLHASKGLEFNSVFIVGCEQGLLPYQLFADRPSDPEEERRLLYVGMTRAKHYLFLTHARRRFLFGKTYENQRSPFLETIEKELVELKRQQHKAKPRKNDGQLSLFDDWKK